MKAQLQYDEENNIQNSNGEFKKENLQIRKGNKSKRRILVWVAVVFVAFFSIIARYSYITQLNYDVAQLKSELTEQTAINSALSIDLDRKMNLPQVRYNATTQLGMQKPDNYQIVYIEVPRCDEVCKAEQPENFYDKLVNTADDVKVSFINLKDIFG